MGNCACRPGPNWVPCLYHWSRLKGREKRDLKRRLGIR